jgi:hypothetical protein
MPDPDVSSFHDRGFARNKPSHFRCERASIAPLPAQSFNCCHIDNGIMILVFRRLCTTIQDRILLERGVNDKRA